MKQLVLSATAAVLGGFVFTSCAEEPDPKPVPPSTETSSIPWNTPIAGQGQGQFGMLPQNQYRR
ncbi:MAG: hypothetical protein ACQCXQ_14435 [Verrucomicrobiales bacterium]|nr:hypothetical protein [Verrucomicrobiota bacterium JB025]